MSAGRETLSSARAGEHPRSDDAASGPDHEPGSGERAVIHDANPGRRPGAPAPLRCDDARVDVPSAVAVGSIFFARFVVSRRGSSLIEENTFFRKYEKHHLRGITTQLEYQYVC